MQVVKARLPRRAQKWVSLISDAERSLFDAIKYCRTMPTNSQSLPLNSKLPTPGHQPIYFWMLLEVLSLAHSQSSSESALFPLFLLFNEGLPFFFFMGVPPTETELFRFIPCGRPLIGASCSSSPLGVSR